MDANGFEYVVLRWADKVPLNAANERVYNEDVDHLIANDSVGDLAYTAARHGGSVKCDWYSVSGQSGSGFLAMPYYMPVLARQILDSRWRDPRGFLQTCGEGRVFSLRFFICVITKAIIAASKQAVVLHIILRPSLIIWVRH